MLNRDATIKYSLQVDTVIIWRAHRGERVHKLIRQDSFLPKSIHRLLKIIDVHMGRNVYYPDGKVVWHTFKWIFHNMEKSDFIKLVQSILITAQNQLDRDEDFRRDDHSVLFEIAGMIKGVYKTLY